MDAYCGRTAPSWLFDKAIFGCGRQTGRKAGKRPVTIQQFWNRCCDERGRQSVHAQRLLYGVVMLFLMCFLDHSNAANARTEGRAEESNMRGSKYLRVLSSATFCSTFLESGRAISSQARADLTHYFQANDR